MIKMYQALQKYGKNNYHVLKNIVNISKIFIILLGFLLLSTLILQLFLTRWNTTDFCQDYLAVTHLLQHKPVYTPIHCWRGKLFIPTHYNPHPPFSILLFLPFGFLSKEQATVAMGFICLSCYLFAGLLLLKKLNMLSPTRVSLFIILSTFWISFLRAEAVLNTIQILLLLLTLSWILEEKKYDTFAGIIIGITSLIRIWPVIFIF